MIQPKAIVETTNINKMSITRKKLPVLLLALVLGFAFIIPSVVSAQAMLDEGAGKVAEPPEKFIYPANMQVPLPGFKYKDSVVAGTGSNGCAVGEVCVYTINYYINAMYRYGAGVAVTFAIVLIMIGGVQYMVGSAVGTIDAAKKRMWNAVIGLVLVLSTHSILTFVNPEITSFRPLGLETVPRESSYTIETRKGGSPIYLDRNQGRLRSFYECEDDDGVTKPCQFDGPDGAIPMRQVVSMNGAHAVDKDIIEKLQGIAGSMHITGVNKGRKLHIKQGYRGYELEARRFFDNCFDGQADCAYCDPWGGEPELSPWTKDGTKYKLKEEYQKLYDEAGGGEKGSAALKPIYEKLGPDIQNYTCPYLTGFTVDITCAHGSGGQKGTILRSGVCHKELEEKMKAHGFCRSYYEPWHFEHEDAAISTSAVLCDWTPGVVVIDEDGNGISDQADCDAVNSDSSSKFNVLRRIGTFALGETGCIADYGGYEGSYQFRTYKFADPGVFP